MDKAGLLIFAHIEKTAGLTMRGLLRRHFGPTQCDLYSRATLLQPSDWKWIRLLYPNLRCLAGHACMPHTFLGDLPHAHFFTFLRDPADRARSAYQYALHRERPMPSFVEWVRYTGDFQTRMLAGESSADKAIELLETRVGFVGLVDRFNESLLLWRHWLEQAVGVPGFDCRYESVNVAPSNSVKQELAADPRNDEALEEHNQLDRQLLRYVREQRYPAQQSDFGATLAAEVEAFEASLQSAPPMHTSWYHSMGRAKRNLLFRPLWQRRTRLHRIRDGG